MDVPLIAVLGGGQLGRMLGLAGIPLGVRFRFLNPTAPAPAAAVGELIVAQFDDDEAVRAFATGATAITYEWEGVPAATGTVATSVAPLRPGPVSLAKSQDRYDEKVCLAGLGIDTAPFAAVSDLESLRAAIETVGVPAVLKTRRGGYDGKGQVVLHDTADTTLAAAWDDVARVPSILEGFVEFTRELSIIAVRGLDGAVRTYPLVENLHHGGVLRRSVAPAPALRNELAARAVEYATTLCTSLDHVGVLTLELFETADGRLVANEFAPRVHNSGHWTIEGATTSQFENHVRAVLGWPLGATDAVAPTTMWNCLGAIPERTALLGIEGVHVHDYGKHARPGRKVGHLTVVDPSPEVTAALDACTSATS